MNKNLDVVDDINKILQTININNYGFINGNK